jgi:hypothetical protein
MFSVRVFDLPSMNLIHTKLRIDPTEFPKRSGKRRVKQVEH